jgi:hypothetical protein
VSFSIGGKLPDLFGNPLLAWSLRHIAPTPWSSPVPA